MPYPHQVHPCRPLLAPVSIVAQINVESRRYSGWIDPRYPIGYWQAALSLTGDATSGLLGIDLLFQQANGAPRLNSQMYSVERFSITASDDVARFARIRAVNMGGPANEGFNHDYAVPLDIITGAGGVAVRTEALTFLPLFLGSQRTAAITAAFSLVTSNSNLIVFHFEAEGYRWSPRSVLVDGGPQRPPTGLYKA